MTEPIGDIGARDQLDASVTPMALAVAAYYRKVRAGGVPRAVALELALQWQGFMLTVGAQTHGQYG